MAFHEIHLAGEGNVHVCQGQLHASVGKITAKVATYDLLQESPEGEEMTGPAVPGGQEVFHYVVQEFGLRQ